MGLRFFADHCVSREVASPSVRLRHALFQQNDLDHPFGGPQTAKTTVCVSPCCYFATICSSSCSLWRAKE